MFIDMFYPYHLEVLTIIGIITCIYFSLKKMYKEKDN